jgi:hypothetical protein
MRDHKLGLERVASQASPHEETVAIAHARRIPPARVSIMPPRATRDLPPTFRAQASARPRFGLLERLDVEDLEPIEVRADRHVDSI